MPRQPLPPPARRPVVLIVDGHEDTRQLYALALSTFGFDTVSVEDSRLAFPRALEAYPDVIITELSMPERDGWQLLRDVKRDPLIGHIPIVAVTAEAQPSVHRQAAAEGFSAVVVKPHSLAELAATLREVLDRTAGRPRHTDNHLAPLRRTLAALRARANADSDPTTEVTARTRRLVEAMDSWPPLSILAADDRARYVAANTAAAAMTGYAPAELMERSIWDLSPPPTLTRATRLWRRFIDDGTTEGGYRLVRKTGEVVSVVYAAGTEVLPGVHISVLASRGLLRMLAADRDRAGRGDELQWPDRFEPGAQTA